MKLSSSSRTYSLLKTAFGKAWLFLFFPIAVLTLMIANACSTVVSAPGPEAPAPQKIELDLWHGWRTEQQAILESIVEEFACRNADVAIAVESPGPSASIVAERMLLDSARRPPDLALVDRDSIPLLAEAGLIRPLEEIFASGGESDILLNKRGLLDSARTYATYDDKLYGVPAYLNPYVLIYDPQILLSDTETARPPVSWTELIAMAGKPYAKPTGGKRWVLSVRSMAPVFHILCAQKGVSLFTPEPGGPTKEAIEDSLEFIRSLRREHSLLPPQHKYWSPQFSGVIDGRALLQFDTAMMFAHIKNSSDHTITAAGVPSDSQTSRTTLGHSPVFVVSTSADKAAVLRFFEVFYSDKLFAQFVKELEVVSPWVGAVSPRRTSTFDSRSYARISSAAEHASVPLLCARSGAAIPRIARIIEQLDAGLVSSQKAAEEIIEAASDCGREAKVSSAASISASWADGTERLFASDRAGAHSPPVWITAAASERESFQLAFSAEVEMEGLTLACAPFALVDYGEPDIKVEFALIDDTYISKPLVAARPGLYPNVLKPSENFSISPGMLTRIWTSVVVPAHVPPGEYSSRIIMRCESAVAAEIPITVSVAALEVPATPSQPAFIGLNYRLIAKHYGVSPDSNEYRQLMEAFYWYLVERRMTPLQPPVPLDSPELASYMDDERVSGCRIPFNPIDKRFETAVALAKRGGWLDRMFSYFIDEPTYHQYGNILNAARRIHSLSDSPKFLVTCFPDDPLIGAVDIWGIHMRFLPEGIPHGHTDQTRYAAIVDRRLEAGDDVWWYTAGAAAPVPSLHIEDDPAAFRIIPWMQQLYRITGFLHWEAANWREPIDDPFIDFFGNGEGVLVYPGEAGPLSSIRLELLREGLEDMELLMLLRDGIERVRQDLAPEKYENAASKRIGEIGRRLICDDVLRAAPSKDVLLLSHFLREPGLIERVREEVINETLAQRQRPYAVVLTEPEEKQYTGPYEARIYGTTESGCHVEINGRDAPVSPSGDFSDRFPLHSGTNRFEILLRNGESTKLIQRKIERY